MKLEKIKLAGFKSFVDPTVIQFQSNLTGIVGPNGCGKSNLIDALRWVMGEISAKQLRGSSMSDVIFNGSSARGQAGKAIVELLFDNSDLLFGGEYARFHEIALRREVTRDGVSNYFINNTACRRKDIINLFLGTGLGDNSYAVIEQGTISQFIEAKPEEIRIFIEEAAGISKYKERRHETELRMQQTQENLVRLNDILTELSRQLRHLKTQANAAERYKQYKIAERQNRAEMFVLSWRAVEAELQQKRAELNSAEQNLEQQTTALHVTQAKLAEARAEHTASIEHTNQLQAEFYQLNADITQREQQINYIKERDAAFTRDLAVLEENTAHALSEQNNYQTKIAELTTQQTVLAQQLTKEKDDAQLFEQQLRQLEQNELKDRDVWDQFNAEAFKTQQQVETLRTQVKYLRQQIDNETRELAKIAAELTIDELTTTKTQLQQLEDQLTALKNLQTGYQQQLETEQQQVNTIRTALTELNQRLGTIRNELQSSLGKRASLESLQQAALGKNDIKLRGWLKEQQLLDTQRLAQQLTVKNGWDAAVELVLGGYLEALCLNAPRDDLWLSLTQLTAGNLTIFDSSISSSYYTAQLDLPLLSEQIETKLALHNLFYGIYAATDTETALQLRSKLAAFESIVTKDGLWIGPNWVRVCREHDPRHGVIQRERELLALNKNIQQQDAERLALEGKNKELTEQLAAAEKAERLLRQEQSLNAAKLSDLQGKVVAEQTQLQYLMKRSALMQEESIKRNGNLQNLQKQLQDLDEKQRLAEQQYEVVTTRRQLLLQKRNELQQQVANARQVFKERERNINETQAQVKIVATQLNYAQQDFAKVTRNLEDFAQRKIALMRAQQDNLAPLTAAQESLNSLLTQHVQSEQRLMTAKQQSSIVVQQLQEFEQKIAQQQEVNERMRSSLEMARLQQQELITARQNLEERVQELNYDFAELNNNLAADANSAEREAEAAQLAAKIEKLGLINLAAIEEYNQLLERHQYLDSQNQDLLKALKTLESAIAKIDADTKEQFHAAFTQINEKFQELFPKIFHGGRAYLELTSDDLLSTGVRIMAEPPGKRNASIQLLSGGEKALTTIALIFAIFHLTPAPFCILDEVDAPLDELNVSRLAQLLHEMSQQIQFIFITHNKTTMEAANQLIGVTMREPGVSRIVSVDIAAAISLSQEQK